MDIEIIKTIIDSAKIILPSIAFIVTAFYTVEFGKSKAYKQQVVDLVYAVTEKDKQIEKLVKWYEVNQERSECSEKENLDLINKLTKQTVALQKEVNKQKKQIEDQTVVIDELKKDLEAYYCKNAPTCDNHISNKEGVK